MEVYLTEDGGVLSSPKTEGLAVSSVISRRDIGEGTKKSSKTTNIIKDVQLNVSLGGNRLNVII